MKIFNMVESENKLPTVVIASDHGGYVMKESLVKYLGARYTIIDCGTDSTDSCDYPDFAEKCCLKVLEGKENYIGILICGTGIGMSISANKIKGIRCALCTDTTSAKLSRQHNNANVVAIGERVIGEEVAKDVVDTFLSTSAFTIERHVNRVNKITRLES